MPKIVRSYPVTTRRLIGRMSDGSDHQEIEETEWFAEVVDRDGVLKELRFPAQPTDADVWGRLDMPRQLAAQTKAQWEEVVEEFYNDWLRWKTTRVEAQARGMAAAVITALTNKENDSWTQYATALNQWRQAT